MGKGLKPLKAEILAGGRGHAQPGGARLWAEPSPVAVEQLVALYRTGRHGEVAAQAEKLIVRHPRSAMLHKILGVACIGLEAFERAEAALARGASLDPDDAETESNLGTTLSAQDKLDEAVAAFRRALAIRPDYAEAHYNLGNALRKQQAVAPAIAAYRHAIALRPDYVDAYNNLGLALHEQGAPDEAVAAYGQALAIRPSAVDVLHNLGNLLMELKNFDGAIKAYRLVLGMQPDNLHARAQLLHAQTHVCDFMVFDEYRALADAGALTPGEVPPFTMLVFEDDPEVQLRYSRAWPSLASRHPPLAVPARAGAEGERIRIGYFSADFHDHATLCLMSGLFREHDRQRFEISAYSYGPDRDDGMRAQLVAHVDSFVDVREMPDAEVVELARGHGLDIAVDLKGYTQHSRSRLFVHRMAPVQINYLGFPGSMGAGFIDYLLADRVVVPEAERRFYDESLIYLPDSYQPNDDRRPIIESDATRAELGLPEDGFVFCCFNQNYKISPREFAIWMGLLAEVEGSVLWLLRSNEWAEANLRREAAARGVDPARLVFAPTLPHAEHLGRLKHADLFLDTFNVNAHTTASDALWAGLPVLTRAGRQFAARVCASLVNAVGLPELVTDSDGSYAARALDLARDPSRLAALRARLAENRLTHPLFATAAYARRLEAAYEAVHRRRVEGLAPADMSISG
jgi:predicted O-linked N-acetylglucosamine transferase (SPINDLY family)